ncbi:hypothetical protein BC830DRAFT_1084488 [Chytriomyces sp. MP71]|nr:hypothetical protein BC830DRAFT_1084488 [Chytriomyces sp. MP71]
MPRWLTLRANLRCEFLVLVICWRVLWTLWLDEDVGVRRSRILSWGLFGLFAGVLQMMFWIEHSCQMLWNHCWVVGWGDCKPPAWTGRELMQVFDLDVVCDNSFLFGSVLMHLGTFEPTFRAPPQRLQQDVWFHLDKISSAHV